MQSVICLWRCSETWVDSCCGARGTWWCECHHQWAACLQSVPLGVGLETRSGHCPSPVTCSQALSLPMVSHHPAAPVSSPLSPSSDIFI